MHTLKRLLYILKSTRMMHDEQTFLTLCKHSLKSKINHIIIFINTCSSDMFCARREEGRNPKRFIRTIIFIVTIFIFVSLMIGFSIVFSFVYFQFLWNSLNLSIQLYSLSLFIYWFISSGIDSSKFGSLAHFNSALNSKLVKVSQHNMYLNINNNLNIFALWPQWVIIYWL